MKINCSETVNEDIMNIVLAWSNSEVSESPENVYENRKHKINQRTNGPVNAHLISWPSKTQNIQNLENIW